MKSHILFSRKKKKKYFEISSAEIFTQHAKCQTALSNCVVCSCMFVCVEVLRPSQPNGVM